MSSFDEYIIRWCLGLAFRWPLFDATLFFLTITNLVKGGVIAALIMWAWFGGGEKDRSATRATLLSMLVAAFGAMFTARGLAHVLPFRVRPLADASSGLHFPVPLDHEALSTWSSFPSDHASLFFALSAGLFFASRRIGILAFLHTTFIICFPRIYLGYHYPTDILAGALIGIVWIFIARIGVFQALAVRPVLAWSERHAPSFYLAFFVLLQQIATVFEDVRAIGVSILLTLKHYL